MRISSIWDYVGMTVSGLCIVHCLLLPFIFVLLPTLGLRLWIYGRTHQVMAVLVVLSCLLAFAPAFFRRRNYQALPWMLVGLVLILFSTLVVHNWLGHMWEPPFSILGGAMLIRAHWINHRLNCAHVH